MLKHITAALAAFFLLLPGSVFAESLDLSKLGDIEEAEQWEERAWYQREDGSDWRVQNDGSVIVTISATGDVTIGGDTRKRGKSIFDKQLAQEELGLDFPLSNVKSIFEADDMTLINFEGTLTNTKSATKNTYSFAAPPEYVQVLTSSSVEAVSLENNHVMDHGTADIRTPCDTLAAAGICVQRSSRRVHFHDGYGRQNRHAGLSDLQRQLQKYLCLHRRRYSGAPRRGLRAGHRLLPLGRGKGLRAQRASGASGTRDHRRQARIWSSAITATA